MTALAPHMEAFLREHLVRHRGADRRPCAAHPRAGAGPARCFHPRATILRRINAICVASGNFFGHTS